LTDTIRLTKVDEVHMRVDADRGILQEISDHFTFEVPGYRFTPAYKNTRWDGKIRVFKLAERHLYIGLIEELWAFARARHYDIEMDYSEFAASEISASEAYDFVKSVLAGVPLEKFDREPRDYQLKSFIDCIRVGRLLLLSPTSSGKSFMIYLLHRYYAEKLDGKCRTLVIVDGTGPIAQMAKDFVSYGHEPSDIHRIQGGSDPDVDRPIVVATWQSLAKFDEDFFSRFDVVIGDEAHHFKAKSLISIMENTRTTRFKFGFTGTIDDSSQVNVMILTGLFGPIKRIVTTAELQAKGYISDLKIKCIILQYPDGTKRATRKFDYDQEMDFLVRNDARNRFIRNLVVSLEGNTLVFFQFVEKHGAELYRLIREELDRRGETDRKVFYMHGGVKGEIRDETRAEFEKEKNAIGVVSYGTFSTAVSIDNIHNLVFGSPTKSKIRNLQSIGRGLRKHSSKEFVTLIDIADNLTYGSDKNYTISHFSERVKTYDSEKFAYKIYNVNLEDG
jgi:superfamily II DNA or RNA helicase